MKKRLTAAIAALCLVLTLLPLNVWAAEGDAPTGDTPKIAESSEALQTLFNDKNVSNIQLKENGSIPLQAGSLSLKVPKGREVTLDLNNACINSSISTAIIVEGKLTVIDSNADPKQLKYENDTVPYQYGSITTGTEGRNNAIRVQNGGTFVLESGTVSAANVAICADGKIDGSGEASSVIIKGGYVESTETAVLVRGQGGRAVISGGILLSKDNAVVSGNGTPKYAGTTIEMSGGTLIGKIATSGYIPCGIYHPQEGILNVTGGEIRAPGGVGILMRGGSLSIGENMTKGNFSVDSAEGTKGKVGDASREIEAGDIIAMDRQDGYYDGANVKVTLIKAAEDVEELRPTAYYSDGHDLDLLWTTQSDNTTVYTIGPKTAAAYTVTFESQGGSPVAPQSVKHGETVTEPAAPTRTDYTFGGWYQEADCTNKWDFATDTVTGDITLYAKWTPVKKNYTITLDANGGTLSGGTIATTNNDGKLTALPAAPTRSGYTFDKWTTSTGTEVTASLVFNGDTTIYAQWKKADGSADDQTYTISFDLNYADAPDAPESISTGADHKPAKPLPAVSREGYSFDGWFTEDMEKVTDNTPFYASVTLKAQWTKNSDTTQKAPYTITLDANGGVSDIETIKTGDDGKLDTLPKAPTRSGYTFLGWYTEKTDGTKITASYAFAADTTIYARWEKDTGTSDPSGDYYHIDYPDRVTGGTFDVSHNRAREGTRITIELSPRSNYELDELEVINADTGGTIRCHERYTDEYTFTMPDSDVEIFLSYQRRDSGGGGYYVPAEPVIPMTGWYCQNGRIYTAAGELMSDRTPLTRDMLLSILYNREGGGAEGHQTWATKNGIVPNYYEGGYYGTDKPLTREQTAMILYCYARYKNYSTSQRAQLTGYSDYREIRPMAQTAMSWARGANLMTGTTSTTLSPTANLTCGQACVLLQRFAANVSWGW